MFEFIKSFYEDVLLQSPFILFSLVASLVGSFFIIIYLLYYSLRIVILKFYCAIKKKSHRPKRKYGICRKNKAPERVDEDLKKVSFLTEERISDRNENTK